MNYIDEFQILNIDKLTYAGNISNLNSVKNHSNYQFEKGDINDSSFLQKIINDFKPDSVINFAAESHVDRSIDDPNNFINTNINGTFELLNACLSYFRTLDDMNKFKFLHVSTDEVYGSLGNKGLFTESSKYNPTSPYSASKASSDHLVKAWFYTYGLPTIVTHCSNNYGPYQFPEKLIPLIIVKCLTNQDLPIYGDGKNIRDWIYVEDHCLALMNILKKGKIGETYNIGGNQEITNIDLVHKICNYLDVIIPSKKHKSYKDLITLLRIDQDMILDMQ